ncbi:uncharacterized membrane protein YidH (DUF202 family) [Lachnospiraceae bacterium PM6-15]|uniref:hypothetical protein n=1 Tax=Ohessyouella blattaphilus TaxID=2949333 RepID=UPI003E234A51
MSKFCTQCGKELEEGEVCQCTTSGQATSGQTTIEAEWLSQRSAMVSSTAKNLFKEMGPILKNPLGQTLHLAKQNSSAIGLQFIAVLAVVAGLMTVLIAKQADFFGFGTASLYFRVFLTVGIVVFGAICLEVLLLKVISGLFNFSTTFSQMFTLSGAVSLFQTIIVLASGIVCLALPEIALFMLVVGFVFTTYLGFALYNKVINGDENKKVYAYSIIKVVSVALITFLIYAYVRESTMGFLGGLAGAFTESMYGDFLNGY